MVEPTANGAPDGDDDADLQRRLRLAGRDLMYLGHILIDREPFSVEHFIMLLRVQDYIKGDRFFHIFECLVCHGVQRVEWRVQARVFYDSVGLHCDAHAEEFHSVSGFTSICCAPNYQPDSEYAWREEGRQLLERFSNQVGAHETTTERSER